MLIDYLKGGPYVKAYFIGFSFTTTGIGAHLEAVTPGKKKPTTPTPCHVEKHGHTPRCHGKNCMKAEHEIGLRLWNVEIRPHTD